jgi:hypothetical protein
MSINFTLCPLAGILGSTLVLTSISSFKLKRLSKSEPSKILLEKVK